LVPQPEQQARNTIDKLLVQAGWSVYGANQATIHALQRFKARNSLRPHLFSDLKADHVLSNPPFNDSNWRAIGVFREGY